MSASAASGPELPLSALAPGESGEIVRVESAAGHGRRLMELGLVPGTRVEVVRIAPLGDPIELRLRQIHLSLRRVEAGTVHVIRAE